MKTFRQVLTDWIEDECATHEDLISDLRATSDEDAIQFASQISNRYAQWCDDQLSYLVASKLESL